jgi:hypothetical protein
MILFSFPIAADLPTTFSEVMAAVSVRFSSIGTSTGYVQMSEDDVVVP